ncbi:paratose synthase [Kosakonia radicincitans]|uniref:NAD-dependent epimerase/dehydratase family protein n=1 Tax=Kosakonia TaxID=1330547 RepID=UPI0009030C20|nr:MULTISPECIES: NAD-dependent epimerase/dehydratase family protein [Kosakonia]APG18793.1 paratose synthase [Kosakonia radicincitans]NCF05448.1 NAD-dependent epimerase/dehydratase family protein [Kosakonia sp. MH5]
MKILLTGVTGYIGNAVMKYLLSQGHEVHGLVRREVQVLNPELHYHLLTGDNLKSLIGFIKPDCVVHIASLFLAAHKYEDIHNLISSNILFPTQLLEAMAENGVTRLINTGTSWQHYDSEEYNPVNLYAATKQSFEDIVKYYVMAKGFSCITLKIYDSYGPGDSRGKLISLLDRLAKTQEKLDMSPGEQMIDLIHIDDVCRAYGIAVDMLHKQNESYVSSFGLYSENAVSLKKLAKIYESANHCQLNINWGGREYREREVMHPANNLMVLPGWKPEIPLEEGIKLSNRY